MKQYWKRNSLTTILCMGILFSLTQCDSTLEPLDQENGSFSIFATVDMDNPVHFFRVDDLKKTVIQETDSKIDALVTLENMNTGNSIVLPDSMVDFDGVYTHNFFTDNIEYGETYKLSVERISDGSSISGQWTAPRRASFEIDGLPAEEGGCFSDITLKYAPVSNISEIDLRIFRVGIPPIKSFRPPFVKGEDESVSATFSLYDISKAIYGIYTDDCRNLEAGGTLLFDLTHYGPDFFENNFTGDIDDLIKVGVFGALYKEETFFRPFKK